MFRREKRISSAFLLLAFLLACLLGAALAQPSFTLRGRVKMRGQETPLHNAVVSIIELRRSAETDDDGNYEFKDLPEGVYNVLAHLEGFPDIVLTVRVSGNTRLDFEMKLAGPREDITVTATGSEQSTFESFQSVTSLDSTSIVENSSIGLGEVLERVPGINKRSFGPGSSRPVIRGFDGDRVLVLQDGMRSGSLGSQSGDHGEAVDVLGLERLEVVKGPATLLYGSNAIGGVVNAVTGHDYPQTGVRGFVTALGGAANAQGGISGGVEVGIGNWLFWGTGSGQRTGDYNTPLGEVPNSKTRSGTGLGGFGYYGPKTFFNLSYSFDDRRYGVPFASEYEGHDHDHDHDEAGEETIDLSMRRHDVRFNGGFRDLGHFINAFKLALNHVDYEHRELEGAEVGTIFNNSIFSYRGVAEQRRTGRLTGRFGFEGYQRDYKAIGAEALAPPVEQNNFAVFTLQEIDFERFRFQLGGRIEHNGYKPAGLRERSFNGFSGAAGVRVGLWQGGAIVANYTHSYRAPALEELYNFGPHIGTLTFEIGNANLGRERSDGIELSLRQAGDRVRAEGNFYYYHINDFVFLAPAGEIEDGLPVADYLQDDARFAGVEIDLDVRLHRFVWLNGGVDYVDAELTEAIAGLAAGTPLPRIPPLRGRVGFEFAFRGLSLRPEAILARDQDAVFVNETRTAGYTVFNLGASYTKTGAHLAHIFTVNAFNLGDRLYRNHLSFIKDRAPEIGRGIRASYTLRFF